ncbi:MAG: phenylalanine--tRNA ligase subunit beta, partial [Bacteroidota bacterium]|nr:phenylalanine--tRNA ligase subunit beta [Bacteroidota bacterium]
MKISYNWINDYLPEEARADMADTPQKLGAILTSVGLELENLKKYEEITGGLKDLFVGEVISCEKHPDADKLKVAAVSNGNGQTLQIVCGASNIASGQKVVVAPAGATIYPLHGNPISIQKTKLRGIESHGMICAEDEIGMGESHEGIIILPDEAVAGMPLAQYYETYSDWILEIGLTPNRMDAMSHLGVAKDVCAYISHHSNRPVKVLSPFKQNFKAEKNTINISVTIENTDACQRYS